MSWYHQWAPRPTVAERKKDAEQKIAALTKKGQKLSPVKLQGTKIASTFWGKAWCKNLESYSDYESRLPRGRSYVRSGSVIDLVIAPKRISAQVMGTSLYKVTIEIDAVDARRWEAIVNECSGKIDSVVELLQGKLSKAVMEIITSKETGLFPAPKQIRVGCSCPDWATLCKHVAATLYGVGARLDEQPDLLFRLRGADPMELIATAAKGAVLGGRAPAKEKRLGADLSSVFGIDLDMGSSPSPAPKRTAAAPKRPAAPAAAPKQPAPRRAANGAARRAAPKKARPVLVTGAALRLLGVPQATVGYWLKTGVLGRTDTPGVYQETPVARERMARYAAARG
jgi:uncharacterized Zn finger protein